MVKIYPYQNNNTFHYKNKSRLEKEHRENSKILKFICSYYLVVFVIFGLI